MVAIVAELVMTILKWALIFLLVSIVAGVLGFTGISAASADIARFLFYVFVMIFLVLLILGLTIFRAYRCPQLRVNGITRATSSARNSSGRSNGMK